MLIKPSFASFRFRRSVALLLVVVSHVFILAAFNRPIKLENKTLSHSMMNIFSVRLPANDKTPKPMGKVDKKIVRQLEPPKNNVQKPIIAESKNIRDVIVADVASGEKVRGEGNSISSKELASLDSLTRRYNVEIPKVSPAEVLTPAQQAAQDPRTNSPRLTKSEKFAVAMGNLDCIFQTRLANGNVIRVPGRWIVVSARSEPGMKTLAKSRFCIRFHQEADENSNDMTAISVGIKGKL